MAKLKITLARKKRRRRPQIGAAGSNDLFTIACELSTIDGRGWTADTRSNPALDPGTGKRGHSDSFELAERRISDGGDCRRRDRATRAIVSVN